MMKKVLSVILVLLLVFMTACQSGGTNAPAQDKPTDNSGQTPSSQDSQTSTDNSSGSSEYRDVIKVGLDVDSSQMDPRTATNVSTVRVNEQIYDGLVDISPSLEAIPCLAESWENPDSLTWIFHLREGVKYHDGSDFTSEDVKHTFDTILDPDMGSTVRSQYTSIKEVVAVDDYTVQFNLSEPYAPLLAAMNIGILPAECDSIENFGSNPFGTGPYKLKEWTKNSKIVMEANENYWREPPATKTLEYYIIPDNSTRIAALEAGDVDLIHSPLSAQDIKRIEGDDRFTVFETDGLGVTFLYFNHNAELLKDKNVRIGLSYMLDKETISSEIYQGLDKPANSPLLPVSWAYSDEVTNYPYDPEKGKEILAEAGWTDTDGDGFLDKDGKKLTVNLSTHTEDPNRIQTVEYIQNIFTMNGIDAVVSTYEWPTFDADVTNGNFELAVIGLLSITDPDKYLYSRFHSKGGANYGGFNNPELDKFLEEGRAVSDQAERAAAYQKAAKIINDDVMHNVLLYQAYVAIYNKNLEGFEPMAAGYFRSLRNAKIK